MTILGTSKAAMKLRSLGEHTRLVWLFGGLPKKMGAASCGAMVGGGVCPHDLS
jgi:hypothetical protein